MKKKLLSLLSLLFFCFFGFSNSVENKSLGFAHSMRISNIFNIPIDITQSIESDELLKLWGDGGFKIFFQNWALVCFR